MDVGLDAVLEEEDRGDVELLPGGGRRSMEQPPAPQSSSSQFDAAERTERESGLDSASKLLTRYLPRDKDWVS